MWVGRWIGQRVSRRAEPGSRRSDWPGAHVAIAKRDTAVRSMAERATLRTMTTIHGRTAREAVEWCLFS